MDELKAHYDRYLLIAAGVILAAVAIFFAIQSAGLSEDFVPPTKATDGAKFAADASVTELRADIDAAGKNHSWEPSPISTFVSRVYLLGEGDRLVDILEGETELFPGIPNKWIVEHNLDYTNPNLPNEDPDNDGFTNLEEFMAGTNPNDPNSRPPLWTKLRLVSSKIDKLRVTFTGLPDGTLDRVSINTISAENPSTLSGGTKFYAPGDMIMLAETDASGKEVNTPTPLKLVRVESRRVFNKATNSEEDAPVIFLLNTSDGKEIELTQGEVKDSPYSLATLRDTRSGQEWQLRTGEEFQIPDSDGKYKLVDVAEEKAQIRQGKSGDILSIPRLTPPQTATQAP